LAVTAPGVWYKTTGTGATYDVNTCTAVTEFDSVVSVFSGSCASLSCIDYNDDHDPLDGGNTCTTEVQSKLQWSTVAGEVYYIFVHPLSAASGGPFELVLTDVSTPPTPTTPTSGTCDNFFLLILAIVLKIFTFGLVNLCT
jgi:hypothetical protein